MCVYVGQELKSKSINKNCLGPDPFEQPILACIKGVKVAVRNKALHGKLARCDICSSKR